MPIVYDESKRIANIAKHGYDFADFDNAFVLLGSGAAKPSPTGRARFKLVGTWYEESVVVAITSPLGTEAFSIVSIRPASEKERNAL